MRLRIAVLRHDLPQVRLLLNTDSKHGPGKQPVAIVSELLSEINKIVPLEAENAWGLEDYVVEVNGYECFHYQELKDILREDDEVVIRGLTSVEVKERTIGYRHQITRDGQHLIDGACFGKRWRGADRRPGVYIPPRKKRRLLMAEEDGREQEQEQALAQFEVPEAHGALGSALTASSPQASGEMVLFVEKEEDERDDDEDDDWNEDDYESVEESSDEASLASEHDDNGDEGSGPGHFEELDDTAGLIQAGSSAEVTRNADETTTLTPHSNRKRKRGAGTPDVDIIEPRVHFADKPSVLVEQRSEMTRIRDTSGDVHHDDTPPSNGLDASSDSVEVAHIRHNDIPTSSTGETTTSEESDTEPSTMSTKDAPTSEAVGDTTSSGSSSSSEEDDTSSSDSESSSDESSDSADSSSSSGSSETSMRARTTDVNNKSSNPSKPVTNVDGAQVMARSKTVHPPEPKPNIPPGKGQEKTKRNNERKKLNKVMARLKTEGKIHQDANFEDLRAYLREGSGELNKALQAEENTVANISGQDQTATEDLNARRQAVFERLNAVEQSVVAHNEQDDTTMAPTVHSAMMAAGQPDTDILTVKSSDPSTSFHSAKETVEEPMSTRAGPTDESKAGEPAPKRARLDAATSRRLIFGALGVRNPKTDAAEKVVREKLAGPVRPVKTKETEQASTPEAMIPPPPKDSDRWKSKLIVTAVECVNKDKNIEVPPFPFKHPWQVRKEKEEARRYEQYYPGEDEEEQYHENDTQDIELEYGEPEQQPSQSVVTSRTLTAGASTGEEDTTIPEDFEELPQLETSDLVPGAVIAYKELHINERFEPEESPYRIAKITANENMALQLQLDMRYMPTTNQQYDDETGDRVYNKFEMAVDDDDEDEPDEGLREISFDQMRNPKLIRSSGSMKSSVSHPKAKTSIDVEASGEPSRSASLRGGHVDESSSSRVLETQPEVDTPRRIEINGMIREAGFDSALDEKLLRPLAASIVAHAEQSTDGRETDQSQNADTSEQQRKAWRSPEGMSSPLRRYTDTSGVRGSSVASESIVESVRYPHLSQLELDTPAVQIQSSSHQDAQRVTPTPLVDESTILPSSIHDEASVNNETRLEDELHSLPSEVPQTQSQFPERIMSSQPDEDNDNGAQQKSGPSPIHGLDGSMSPPPVIEDLHDDAIVTNIGPNGDDEDESLDSNGFPSLRALTSSQAHNSIIHTSTDGIDRKGKSQTATTRLSRRSPRATKSLNELLYRGKKVSPVPSRSPSPEHSATRKSARTRKPTKKTSTLFFGDFSDFSEQDSPSSARVKASQSQQPRLSQIPDDTVVVDLTQESPSGSPASAKDETKVRNGGRGAGRFGSSQQVNVFKKSFEGLGEKSLLKKKKRSL